MPRTRKQTKSKSEDTSAATNVIKLRTIGKFKSKSAAPAAASKESSKRTGLTTLGGQDRLAKVPTTSRKPAVGGIMEAELKENSIPSGTPSVPNTRNLRIRLKRLNANDNLSTSNIAGDKNKRLLKINHPEDESNGPKNGVSKAERQLESNSNLLDEQLPSIATSKTLGSREIGKHLISSHFFPSKGGNADLVRKPAVRGVKEVELKKSSIPSGTPSVPQIRNLRIRLKRLNANYNLSTSSAGDKNKRLLKRNRKDDEYNGPKNETSQAERQLESNNNLLDEQLPSIATSKTLQSSKSSLSNRSLTNDSDAIEQLILSDEVPAVENQTSVNENKQNRFFHSRILTPKSSNSTKKLKKRNIRQKLSLSHKSRSSKTGIYDFLSQSSSDSNDPAADIIQKLIAEGKVAVATVRKGTGRLEMKKGKRKPQTKKAMKAIPQKKTAEVKPITEEIQNKNNVVVAAEVDFGDLVQSDRVEAGSFSKLARSTMVKQGEKSGPPPPRQMVTDRMKLLQAAKSFVHQSTPVNNKSSPNIPTTLSPIQSSSCPSPFRVDDDNLPRVFNFSRNSENLPTYSSDVIPCSPSKRHSRINSNSTFNDSNAENIQPNEKVDNTSNQSPTKRSPLALTNRINQTKLSLNPRRALSYRSPLKDINIIDVVTLTPVPKQMMDKLIGNESVLPDNDDTAKPKKSAPTKPSSIADLFGFDDILEEESNLSDKQLAAPSKDRLSKKLKDLKRLLPTSKPMRFSYGALKGPNKVMPAQVKLRPKKPASLQEMFCSTMIERQRKESELPTFTPDESVDTEFLFNDLDPELTFDEKTPRKTYSREKRRRKVKHDFIMFHNDESEEEEKQSSHEERRPRTKRQLKEKQQQEELKKYAEEFNSMCEEVDQYELAIE